MPATTTPETRGLFDDATTIGTTLFAVWVASAEGGLRATFELQNATLAATTPLLEAAVAGQRGALQQWDAAVRQSQQAVLDAFHAQVRAAGRVAQTTPR